MGQKYLRLISLSLSSLSHSFLTHLSRLSATHFSLPCLHAPLTTFLHGRAGCCRRQAAASGCRRVWRRQQRGLVRRPALAPHPSGSSERLPASMAWAAARLGLERLRRGGVTNVGGRKVFAHQIGSVSTNSQRIRRRRYHLTAAATTDVPSRRFLSGNGTRPSPRERMAASRFALESHNKPAIDGIIIVIVHALKHRYARIEVIYLSTN